MVNNMNILKCYSMTEKEVKTFCNAYTRLNHIGWIEFDLLGFKENPYRFDSSDPDLTLLDVLRYFLNPYIDKMFIEDNIIYLLSDKTKKHKR